MKWVIASFIMIILLFGCTDNGGTPTDNQTKNETPVDENDSQVEIIIGEQTNQTVTGNATIEEPEQNETPTKELEYYYDENESFAVYFIAVGSENNGNAIFVKKGDLDILIDGGPAEDAGQVVDLLKDKEVDDLEVVISTNADPKQYGGLETVADNFQIEQFWWGGNTFFDEDYEALLERMENSTKQVKVIGDGDEFDLNGMNFTFLNPPEEKFNDINNDAIVTMIKDRNLSLLLTSSILKGAQLNLANVYSSNLHVDIMQAPFYGVGEGTRDIALFLVDVDPERVIITGSSEDTPENGGSREPFKSLMESKGIAWNETYVEGTIKIFCNMEDCIMGIN